MATNGIKYDYILLQLTELDRKDRYILMQISIYP